MASDAEYLAVRQSTDLMSSGWSPTNADRSFTARIYRTLLTHIQIILSKMNSTSR